MSLIPFKNLRTANLQTKNLLLDGGLSNVLEAQGHDLNHPLWSAKLLATDPEALVQAHLAYLRAGAQCITTASYQATIPGMKAVGYTQSQAEDLILRSVAVAEEAIRRFLDSASPPDRPLIAASIGPYGAFLADGSEYRGNYGVSDEHLREFHQPRIDLLDRSAADCFACETLPSYQEARVLAQLLLASPKPAWISFSCRDEGHLHDGTPMGEAVDLFAKHPQVFAIGVNCTAPRYISGLIPTIRAHCGDKKIIVYPNSGERYDPASKTWQSLSEPLAWRRAAQEWRALGADILGGCCRIGPEEIAALAEMIP